MLYCIGDIGDIEKGKTIVYDSEDRTFELVDYKDVIHCVIDNIVFPVSVITNKTIDIGDRETLNKLDSYALLSDCNFSNVSFQYTSIIKKYGRFYTINCLSIKKVSSFMDLGFLAIYSNIVRLYNKWYFSPSDDAYYGLASVDINRSIVLDFEDLWGEASFKFKSNYVSYENDKLIPVASVEYTELKSSFDSIKANGRVDILRSILEQCTESVRKCALMGV